MEELCSSGDLLTYVRKRRRLAEPIARYILKQVLEALYHCHTKGILHRDIKPDNILIKSDSTVKVSIKI